MQSIEESLSEALRSNDWKALVKLSGRVARLAMLLRHESEEPCAPSCIGCEDS